MKKQNNIKELESILKDDLLKEYTSCDQFKSKEADMYIPTTTGYILKLLVEEVIKLRKDLRRLKK